MWRHAKGDCVVILAEILERKRVVALVTVQNQQPVPTYSAVFSMGNKVLQPLYAKII